MAVNIFSHNEVSDHKNIFGINVTSIGYCIAKTSPALADKHVLELCVYETWKKGVPEGKLISDKLKELGLDGSNYSTILNEDDYVLLNVEAPDVPEDEVVSAVRWSIGDMVDFDIGSAVIDVFDSPVAGGEDKQKSIYVAVAQKDKVSRKANFLQNAQAGLSVIDIPELVLRNLASMLPENEEGVAILYMMGEMGLILLIRDSYIYLARRLDIGIEDLKVMSEAADSSENTAIQETNPQLETLVLEVLRSIDYYDRYFSLTPLSGLVIMPMENELPGFQEALTKMLGINVKYLDLNDLLDCKTPLNKQMQEHCFLAVGAALRANLEQQEVEQKGREQSQEAELNSELNLEANE